MTTKPAMTCDDEREFVPCPLCKQYSHSIGEDQVAAAFNHFQSMFSHRGDGIPTQPCFDEQTRDAAQVLMGRISQLTEQLREAEWKPIESAPKDGTPVLLFDPDVPEVTVGSYDPDEERWGDDRCRGFPIKPPCWRLLPDPPSLKE